jgi:hypothetical protein
VPLSAARNRFLVLVLFVFGAIFGAGGVATASPVGAHRLSSASHRTHIKRRHPAKRHRAHQSRPKRRPTVKKTNSATGAKPAIASKPIVPATPILPAPAPPTSLGPPLAAPTLLAPPLPAPTLPGTSPALPTSPGVPPSAPRPFFSPSSLWNQLLAPDAPLDPSSVGIVSELGTYVARTSPWIDATHDGVTIVTVPADQPTVVVKLDHVFDTALTAAWSAVPLPPSALPSSGDNDLAVWQPSTDRMWEFSQLNHQADGWHATWGGAMQSVSSNPGVYGPDAWPGAKTYWGVTAASLPIVGGAMTFDDLAAGQINHALALVVPNVRQGVFAAPAQRQDGTSTSATSLPEGAHLRLDPSLNLASLNLPPFTLIIAKAAQRYGIIIRDQSPTIAFIGQDPTGSPTAWNTYVKLYGGRRTGQLMAAFPWSHLEVLKMALSGPS